MESGTVTFSLIARDPETGMFGIALTSSAVAVANRCPWVRAGVGAVTTQHRTDTRAGPIGLDLLSQGCSAQETVKVLALANDHPGERQFAAVDRHGRAAFYTGPEITNINTGFVGNACVSTGNFIASADIPQIMVEAYEGASGMSFAERLLAAVDAGYEAGGETKPIRSAGLLIADREAWPLVDLRIDWDEAPLKSLRALWNFYEPHQQLFVKQVLAPNELKPLVDSPMNV
ncbi:DUF1028 domain-containing protein [Propylenella binzhouense]|uniref:DUF1028 domain-containing protein n=1 Tax=Propylenella binzhouense TaxID=2555902 RepID=A0A964T1W2_9HYPH|nr:DUF1028 domain-containing protein [Propylenella binzhouense]MYZ46439.1 DUF1028 domain-containing protein [Propylenella binzhouense]